MFYTNRRSPVKMHFDDRARGAECSARDIHGIAQTPLAILISFM